ncbi:MAG: precorrin-8X methylmutase [Pseudomonadota bacterium]
MTVEGFDYLRDPDTIYERSFAIIEAETDWASLSSELRPVALRMIHASGMTELVGDLAASNDFVTTATATLRGARPVIADCRMVQHGIIRRQLPAANPIACILDEQPHAPAGDTRSAAAIDRSAPLLDGALVVIGNAPTALFRLLERIASGTSRPAAVVGLPVGFVGAAESKAALAAAGSVPFLTLHGRRGGSPMAAAAVNALARLAGRAP